MPRTAAIALLGLSLALAGGEAPSPAQVREAVTELGSDEVEMREAAFRRLLAWGTDHPDAVLPALPPGSDDPEIARSLGSLRRQVRDALSLRECEAFIGKDPWLRQTLDALRGIGDSGPQNEHAMVWLAQIADTATHIRKGEQAAHLLALSGILRHSDLEVRKMGWQAVADLQQASVAPRLLPFLKDTDPWQRSAAAKVLGHLGAEEAVPGVMALLADPEGEVRASAVFMLAKISHRPAAKEMRKLLFDPDRRVRALSARALGKLEGPGAAPAVRPLLDDPEPMVRGIAVTVLCAMEDRASLPAMLRLLDRPEGLALGDVLPPLGKLVGEPWTPDEAGLAAAKVWRERHPDAMKK